MYTTGRVSGYSLVSHQSIHVNSTGTKFEFVQVAQRVDITHKLQ